MLLPLAAILITPLVALTPGSLRTEYLLNPVGLEERHPRFSYTLESPLRAQSQSACQILAASSAQGLATGKGDLWDSGKVGGNATTQIVYLGKLLASAQQVYWKVRVWDQDNRASAWSAPAQFSMGLLQPSDWKAEWISHRDRTPLHTSRKDLYLPAARYYRKRTAVTKPVRRATLFASALGVFDAYVNGRRVSERMFSPGWSDYRRRAYYTAADVTSLLARGDNVIGAIVAEGWYSGYVGYGLLVGYGPNKAGRYFYGKTPALLAQVHIEHTDGSVTTVGTDGTWKVSTGAYVEADIQMGETYDARLEPKEWAATGFGDSKWEQAIPAAGNGAMKAPFFDRGGEHEVELGFVRPQRLQAYPGPPVSPMEELRAVRMSAPAGGTYIFDLGQNVSGVVRLRVKGAAGTRVRLRYGEMLHGDGRLMTENLRRARATDTYILRGDSNGETYTPRFTYHGFRFVELTGYPGKPGLEAVTGIVVHSDTALSSTFSSSDEVINKLHRNIVWTQRSNFVEIPTDCPQRDERLAWTGDAQTYVRAATYNADVAAFFTKWLDDLEESQRTNGAYPDYAPYPMQHGDGMTAYGTGWMDAGIIVPHTIWRVYGDRRVLQRHWRSMTRFMDFRRRSAPDFRGVKQGNPWGDWLAIGPATPIELLDAAYFALTTRLMVDMAEALGRTAEAAMYRKWYESIRARFQKDYVVEDGKLKVPTQTAYALALYTALLPRSSAVHLVKQVERSGYRMTTGFLGTRPLIPVLSRTGHHDLAARLFQSREFPSWGYEVVNGATTIWERWNSYTKEKGIHEPGMNSFSHYAFGAVSEWMFHTLAGIDTEEPGFQKLLIRPRPPAPGSNPVVTPIHWVKASYESPHGRIRTNWRREPKAFHLEVEIAANTTAMVMIPAEAEKGVTEGGRPLRAAPGVEFLRLSRGEAVLRIASGGYQFVSVIP